MELMIEQMEFLNDSHEMLKKYDKRIQTVAKTANLTDIEAATLAILLNNTEKALNRYARRKALSDTTFSEVIGPFKKHAMNIVSALYSTFTLKDIISIQPLTQKIGALYFLNYIYANTKGDIAANDVAFSPTEKPKMSGYYTSEVIKNEIITPTAPVGDIISHTLAYFPVRSDKLEDISIVVVAAGASGEGTWTATDVVGGVINITNGAEVGTIVAATGATEMAGFTGVTPTSITATYRWHSEKNRTLTPKITVRVDEELVTAERRPLLFDVMLDATYDFENQFGRSLNAEVEEASVREIQNELAYYILGTMHDGGWDTVAYTFDMTPTSGISLADHFQNFTKFLSEMSMQCFKNLGRGKGNVVVSGGDLVEFLEAMPSTLWESAPQHDARGPYKVGRLLKKYDVYHNPATADDEFFLAYKGKDWWEAPYFLGSYLPLMATKFMLFPDLHGEQGYITMDAHKYLFPQHVIKGSVFST